MMGKGILLVSALIIGLMLFSGCTQPTGQTSLVESGKTMFVCPSGDLVSNPDLCPSTGTAASTQSRVEAPQTESCPYECCYQEDGYYNKTCPGKQLCQNNKCAKQICPYECCGGQDYDFKGCQTGKTCQNNTCVQTNCPFECCDGSTYAKKDCGFNKECINNTCTVKACQFECCEDGVYQNKGCSEGFVCQNNLCEKIKKPKISLKIDECVSSINVFQGLGEVTDIFVTVSNFGDKEAADFYIRGTANDVEQDLGKSYGYMSALPAKQTKNLKLTVDTDSQTPTEVTVSTSCNECETQTATTSDCHYDIRYIVDNVASYVPLEQLARILPWNQLMPT